MAKKRDVDPDAILARLPELAVGKRQLMTFAQNIAQLDEYTARKDGRIGELREAGLNKADRGEIAWREWQMHLWLAGAVPWPDPPSQLVMQIRCGMVQPLQTMDADRAQAANAERDPLQEPDLPDPEPTAMSLTEALLSAEADVDEITRQLEAGQGRQCSFGDMFQWVADNLDNAAAMPEDAPSNGAYSMLLSAREDRKSFWAGMRQVMKDTEDVRDTLDDPRFRELNTTLDRFAGYRKFEQDMQLLRDLLPIARLLDQGMPVPCDETTQHLVRRIIEVAEVDIVAA